MNSTLLDIAACLRRQCRQTAQLSDAPSAPVAMQHVARNPCTEIA